MDKKHFKYLRPTQLKEQKIQNGMKSELYVLALAVSTNLVDRSDFLRRLAVDAFNPFFE